MCCALTDSHGTEGITATLSLTHTNTHTHTHTQFESCTQTLPTEFQEIYDVEVADRNGRVQAETNQVSLGV